MSLYQHLFYTRFTTDLCSERKMVALMIEVELALAKAQEESGLIPTGTSEKLSRFISIEKVDMERLMEGVGLTGNAVAPLVNQLVAMTAEKDTGASKYIHLGATSQDIIDTSTILKIKLFDEWLMDRTVNLVGELASLAREYASTPMMGRTLMQQARPISFGLKVANWLQGIGFSLRQMDGIRENLQGIQLGGAVGSRNALLGADVQNSFASSLSLKVCAPWHTQRERIISYVNTLGVLVGSLGKIAKDIVLLSQTEVGEINEPAAPGRGTSSTMPHKRNPVLSTAILANAQRVPFLIASMLASLAQSHERSAGEWHAEWEVLDDILGLTAGAMEKSLELIRGLEVHPERMRQNIELTQGLVFAESLSLALAKEMGKEKAHEIIQVACQTAIQEKLHLRNIIESMDLGFSPKQLNELFDPEKAMGLSMEVMNKIIEKYEHSFQH